MRRRTLARARTIKERIAAPAPMLASLAAAPLDDPALVYEPKYDGIRAIADVDVRGVSVRLWSRLGNDKSAQFPEIVEALSDWARSRRKRVVLDGEIVALDDQGRPAGFQNLQGRIHVTGFGRGRAGRQPTGAGHASAAPEVSPVAFVAFDVLHEGAIDWRNHPLTERRTALERLVGRRHSAVLRLSAQVRGDGRAMRAQAEAEGWEGLIAKRATSIYRSGKRSPDWRKLKIVHEQEFVVGGWTEPRHSRSHFGALIVGVHGDDAADGRSLVEPGRGGLIYAGHVGTGFDDRELARVMARLRPLEIATCPFAGVPPANERAHWVQPTLVAQVRFAEWTADRHLRHPVYLGLRDDKDASAVRRDQDARPVTALASGSARADRAFAPGRAASSTEGGRPDLGSTAAVLVEALREIEDSRHDGVLQWPPGQRLKVTNLHKVFWPRGGLTKGDLFRYYARAAPFVLPAIANRPLVMKRFPNGVAEKPFYQHRVESFPEGVRVEGAGDRERSPQIVGGDLLTLLYTTQLAAISQDPWFSRVGSIDAVDYIALDLDPAPGVDFARVLEVARRIRDELERIGAPSVVKTSGADGAHVYVPLQAGTPYEAGLLFAQIVATLVAQKAPKAATVERSLRSRGSRVYIDYLQNVRGKTLASAYSARASDYAGVSTPLTWEEVEHGVDREAFTITTVPARLERTGDLWSQPIRSNGVNLEEVAGRLR